MRVKRYRFNEQTVNPTFEHKRQVRSIQRHMSLIGLSPMAHMCHGEKALPKEQDNQKYHLLWFRSAKQNLGREQPFCRSFAPPRAQSR
jgi:hypothetical protein